MGRARHKELVRDGLTGRQAAALHIISILGKKATPANIAMVEMREPHTVSHMILSLEELGMVRRCKDLDKANQVRAELTEKGLECYEKCKPRQSIYRIIGCLTDKERGQLVDLLDKVSAAAKKELSVNGG